MPTTCRRCPARRYLKVHAADLTRFRAAMVSAPPAPGRPVQKDSGIVVFSARNTAPAPAPAAADPAAESVLDAAVRRLAPSVLRAHQVWLPPLEPALALDVVLSAQGDQVDGSALRVALGIIDRPAHQARQVLALDLDGTAGHVAVVGAPQSGKSTLVRAFLAAACTTYPPERLAFYCLDLGGGDLAVFEPAPQVGTVAGRGRPELVRGVVRTVAGLLAGRERLFAARGIDSADAFRGLRARGALPAESLGDVVLVIDNWPALRAEYDDLEPLVLDIATRGLGYGIHLLLTAARWSDIRPNLRDGIGGRLELRLGDPNESEVDRRQAASLPRGIPGRGLTTDGEQFQAALPRLDGAARTADLHRATANLVAAAARNWTGRCVPTVRILPARVDASRLPLVAGASAVPVGFAIPDDAAGPELEPVAVDLSGADPHLLVLGDAESGRTTFLRTYLSGLCAQQFPGRAQVLLVDYRRTLLDDVPPDHLLGYAGTAPAAAALAADVRAALDARLPGTGVSLAQLPARSWWEGPELYLVVDDYELLTTAGGNPLAALADYLPQARDLGLHVILTRRVGGIARAMFEPLLQRHRELGGPGLLLSGDPSEGPLLDGIRASGQPPGRGLLVRRRREPVLVQIAS